MVCLLSNKRLAITARTFDTGISIPPGAPATAAWAPTAGAVGWAPTADAPAKSLDVIDPYNPEPFKPF